MKSREKGEKQGEAENAVPLIWLASLDAGHLIWSGDGRGQRAPGPSGRTALPWPGPHGAETLPGISGRLSLPPSEAHPQKQGFSMHRLFKDSKYRSIFLNYVSVTQE